ncbi:portal protein [Sphingomonas baiyangensis]|uniref:Portal protein n=2 Tax=Sphingomonas baiyangensis TaxID=2572576 RepID=A0A4U1L174_9SPHN|nr:hypothetical protein FBR43_07180 [Sphingomonas baiyangensis]
MEQAVAVAESPQDSAGEQKPLGPFQLPDEELVQRIWAWFKESSSAKAPAAKKRKKDFRVYAGRQWDEGDEALAKKLNRPALTLNMVLTIISAVEGEEREERQDIKYFGNGGEDDGAAWGLNRILKWIMQQCGGEFTLSRQFRDGTICGEAWIVPEVDFFDDPEGKIKLELVDDCEVFDDPLAKCPVSSDSRYFIRQKQMTAEELEARWPGSVERLTQAVIAHDPGTETDGSGYRDIYSEPGRIDTPKHYDSKTKLWTVMETWWHQIEPGWVVRDDATGLLEEKTPEEFEALKAARAEQVQQVLAARVAALAPPPMTAMIPGMPAPAAPPVPEMPPPIEAVERPVRRFYQAFSVYRELLDKQPSPMPRLKRVPYVPFRAFFDKDEGEYFGLVRPITDVQLQHNVEQSVIVQMMQLQPKSSWMGPKGSFHNKVEWQNKLAQPGSLLEYNQSRGGKPEPIPVQPISRHLIEMADARPQTMRAISGVNVEMTGQRQGSDAGVVMEKRKKAARTVLAPIFDNHRMTKHALGTVLLAYIQKYVSVGRRLRVIGPEGKAEDVVMSADMQIGRYDISVGESDESMNDRFEALYVLQTVLPAMMKSGMPITPEFVDLLPIPPHIRQTWKRYVAWKLTLEGAVPPPGWEPGMPNPFLPAPGAAPPLPGPPMAAPPAQ